MKLDSLEIFLRVQAQLPRQPQLNRDPVSITVINRNTYFARGREWRDYFFLVPFFVIVKGPQTLQLRGLGHRWALYPFFWLWWLVQKCTRDRSLVNQRPSSVLTLVGDERILWGGVSKGERGVAT